MTVSGARKTNSVQSSVLRLLGECLKLMTQGSRAEGILWFIV